MNGDECYQRLLIMLFPQNFVTSFMSYPSYLIDLIDLIVARIRTSNVWFSDGQSPILSLRKLSRSLQHVDAQQKDEKEQNASSCDQNLRHFMPFPISDIPIKLSAACLLDMPSATPLGNDSIGRGAESFCLLRCRSGSVTSWIAEVRGNC